MAKVAPTENMLYVPHGGQPIQDSFVNFLWERDLPAFLVKNDYIPKGDRENLSVFGVLRLGSC